MDNMDLSAVIFSGADGCVSSASSGTDTSVAIMREKLEIVASVPFVYDVPRF